jgi:hypothetical protein
MPTPVTMTIVSGRLAIGPSGDALVSYDCQVVSAACTPADNATDVPATFCAGARSSVARSSWTLDVTLLQDWSADATSFCWYTIDHETEEVVWELVLDTGADPPTLDAVTMHGTAQVTAFPFGGDAGTPLQATKSWPIVSGPTRGPAPASLVASTAADTAPVDDTVAA